MSVKIGLFLGVTPPMGGVFQYSQCLLRSVAALSATDFTKVIAFTDDVWGPAISRLNLHGFRVPSVRWSLMLGALVTCVGFPIPLWHRVSTVVDPAARRLRREACDLWIFSSYSCVCYQMPAQPMAREGEAPAEP